MINPIRLLLPLLLTLLLAIRPATAVEEWVYVVQPDDNLKALAKRILIEGKRGTDIADYNKMSDATFVRPGARLRIPLDWLPSTTVDAEVAGIYGEPFMALPGGEEKQAAVGAPVASDTSLVTDSGQTLVVRFADGSTVQLEPKGWVRTVALNRYGDTGIYLSRLALEEGEVEVYVAPSLERPSRVALTVGDLQIISKGARFRVRLSEDGARQIEVIRGTVIAIRGGSEVELTSGVGLVIDANGVTGPRQPLPVPPLFQIDGDTVLEQPFTLAWNPQGEEERFRLRLTNREDPLLPRVDAYHDENQAAGLVLDNGRYEATVRAVAANGLEGLDAQRRFEISQSMEAPIPQFPLNGSVQPPGELAFEWLAGAGTEYRLQVLVEGNTETPVVDSGVIKSTQFTSERTLPIGHYQWRVAVLRDDGTPAAYSATTRFEVREGLAYPEHFVATTAGDGLAAEWASVVDAQAYRVQVARHPGFDEIASDGRVTEPNWRLDSVDAGVYWVRVATINHAGFAGRFSPAQQVQVEPGTGWHIPAVAWLLLLLLF